MTSFWRAWFEHSRRQQDGSSRPFAFLSLATKLLNSGCVARILTISRLIYTLKHSLAWAVYPTGENNKGVIPCWRPGVSASPSTAGSSSSARSMGHKRVQAADGVSWSRSSHPSIGAAVRLSPRLSARQPCAHLIRMQLVACGGHVGLESKQPNCEVMCHFEPLNNLALDLIAK
jgi:hypothetical protein